MNTFINYIFLFISIIFLFSCAKDDVVPAANNLSLQFNNTFKGNVIVLGEANSNIASSNTSVSGQVHHFSELKYVISNIRLVRADGSEYPYHMLNLDKGATVIDQSKPQTLNFVLQDIPAGTYKTLKFGLGIKQELNVLDQVKFPGFYALAGANDTKMMWEWGTGYRFTKIEGFYDTDHKTLSIHTGSTVAGKEGAYTQGVDAYREITLSLETQAQVGKHAPIIRIQADFDKMLSGKLHTITLSTGNGNADNATPNIHTAVQMLRFVDNLAGNGSTDLSGMFSISKVEN